MASVEIGGTIVWWVSNIVDNRVPDADYFMLWTIEVRKDSLLVLSDTFSAFVDILRRVTEDSEVTRAELFDTLLDSYIGYDIVEVICREAAVSIGYDYIGQDQQLVHDIWFNHYLEKVARTGEKYANSVDWPQIETKRAEALIDYVKGL